MSVVRVCCDSRVELKHRRLFHGITMRLFVMARKNMPLPECGSICNTCRMYYRKWLNNVEFIHILDRLEEELKEMAIDSSSEVRLLSTIYIYIYIYMILC